MLIISLVLSGIFVVILLRSAGNGGEPQRKSSVLGLAFLGIPAGIILGSVTLLLNAFLVSIAAAIITLRDGSPRAFRRSIWGGTVFAYLVLAGWRIYDLRDIIWLRERYPLEAISERLTYEQRALSKDKSEQPLAEPTASRLSKFEDLLSDTHRGVYQDSSALTILKSLEDLHGSYLGHFVRSPGSGVGRMFSRDKYRNLLFQPTDESQPPTLPPPAYDDPVHEKDFRDPWMNGKPSPGSAPGRDELGKFHLDGLVDFVNSGNFGYIRNRNAVAGFKPHQFSSVPNLAQDNKWQLDTLELVSLLKHAEPMAYVSRELPRMDKLREVPVRPLTDHERTMLDGLRRGEDLQVLSIPDRIRMLGAIRAAEQCLQCHEVARGTLLGAFSYKLRLVP